MRSYHLTINWVYLLIQLLPAAVAYGERGIAERMLYWSAYLCEEQTKILDPSYEYTVAPGCITKEPMRTCCTLDEFLIYLWAPKHDSNPPDTERPDKMAVSTDIEDLPGKSFNQFEGALNRARFDTGLPVDGNVDTSKLYPGATDYYDALSKMGKPIQALSSAFMNAKANDPSLKMSNKINKPWLLGKNCAAYVFALRRKDMDVYRATFLREELRTPPGLHGGFIPVFTNIETAKTVQGGTPESIPAIDFDETISRYISTVPDIETVLKEQNDAFMNVQRTPGEFINKNHLKAVEAARSAVTGCNCETVIPRELKKRQRSQGTFTRAVTVWKWKTDPASVHWGGPKAARSRKMRARRLARIGIEQAIEV
ncbi:hypothetical protein FDENT_3010 [Fusarium denticulatum]|uniref:Uncharacterized protein n=1 Tax=Fusarium denticulatum TaxID=48507 RepID=A0A8H5XEP7_9HYPO|nr:hypothetical protein FDENT_3010 [Fusarium denticulatum]